MGLLTIWAIGVGSAIGGSFFGWQFIVSGGFGSGLIAVFLAGVFYWLYAGAMTELAARYRSSGGAFDFCQAALGKRTAALMAVLALLKLILANAGLALSISSYLMSSGLPIKLQLASWVVTYGICTGLDCAGIRQSASLQVVATCFCLLVLFVYVVSCLTKFDIHILEGGGLIHDGAIGFLKGVPFALQFFDGFEDIPLMMSYSIDPEKTIPRALGYSYMTVAILSITVLLSGSGITSSTELLSSEAPLMDGIDYVFGVGKGFSRLMGIFICLGLFVNFFAFVVFTSQQVHAIAAAGQFPSLLSYRHPVHGAPVIASIASSVIGVTLTTFFVLAFGEDAAQNTLVTGALMPAVLGYVVLLECIVELRKVEDQRQSKSLSSVEIAKLGYDPGSLRWGAGVFGARVAQCICGIFVLGLLVLALTNALDEKNPSPDFLYGLVVVTALGCGLYANMHCFIVSEEVEIAHLHQLISTEDDANVDEMSDNPFQPQKSSMGNRSSMMPSLPPRNNRTDNPMTYSAVDDDDEVDLALEMLPFKRYT